MKIVGNFQITPKQQQICWGICKMSTTRNNQSFLVNFCGFCVGSRSNKMAIGCLKRKIKGVFLPLQYLLGFSSPKTKTFEVFSNWKLQKFKCFEAHKISNSSVRDDDSSVHPFSWHRWLSFGIDHDDLWGMNIICHRYVSSSTNGSWFIYNMFMRISQLTNRLLQINTILLG